MIDHIQTNPRDPRQAARPSTPGIDVAAVRQRRSRRRGSAMIEAVLTMPFLLFIFLLVMYFGASMERMQRATMMDRYESWRGQAHAPGPAARLSDSSSTSELNQAFFADDRAETLRMQPTNYFPREPIDLWVDEAALISADAGAIAEGMDSELPSGRSIRFSTSHTNEVDALDDYVGAILHRHTRLNGDWRFMNHVIRAGHEEWFDETTGLYRPLGYNNSGQDIPPSLGPARALRSALYQDFDNRLAPYTSTNDLARNITGFYTQYPYYRGPKVPTEWDSDNGWY